MATGYNSPDSRDDHVICTTEHTKLYLSKKKNPTRKAFIISKKDLEKDVGKSKNNWFENATVKKLREKGGSIDVLQSPATDNDYVSSLTPVTFRHPEEITPECSIPRTFRRLLNSQCTPSPRPSFAWMPPSIGISPVTDEKLKQEEILGLSQEILVKSLGISFDDSLVTWTSSLETPTTAEPNLEELSPAVEYKSVKQKGLPRALFSPGPVHSTEESDGNLDSTAEEAQQNITIETAVPVSNVKKENTSLDFDSMPLFSQDLHHDEKDSEMMVHEPSHTEDQRSVPSEADLSNNDAAFQYKNRNNVCSKINAKVACVPRKQSKDGNKQDVITNALSDFFDPPSKSVGRRRCAPSRGKKRKLMEDSPLLEFQIEDRFCSTPVESLKTVKSILTGEKKRRKSKTDQEVERCRKRVRFCDQGEDMKVLESQTENKKSAETDMDSCSISASSLTDTKCNRMSSTETTQDSVVVDDLFTQVSPTALDEMCCVAGIENEEENISPIIESQKRLRTSKNKDFTDITAKYNSSKCFVTGSKGDQPCDIGINGSTNTDIDIYESRKGNTVTNGSTKTDTVICGSPKTDIVINKFNKTDTVISWSAKTESAIGGSTNTNSVICGSTNTVTEIFRSTNSGMGFNRSTNTDSVIDGSTNSVTGHINKVTVIGGSNGCINKLAVIGGSTTCTNTYTGIGGSINPDTVTFGSKNIATAIGGSTNIDTTIGGSTNIDTTIGGSTNTDTTAGSINIVTGNNVCTSTREEKTMMENNNERTELRMILDKEETTNHGNIFTEKSKCALNNKPLSLRGRPRKFLYPTTKQIKTTCPQSVYGFLSKCEKVVKNSGLSAYLTDLDNENCSKSVMKVESDYSVSEPGNKMKSESDDWNTDRLSLKKSPRQQSRRQNQSNVSGFEKFTSLYKVGTQDNVQVDFTDKFEYDLVCKSYDSVSNKILNTDKMCDNGSRVTEEVLSPSCTLNDSGQCTEASDMELNDLFDAYETSNSPANVEDKAVTNMTVEKDVYSCETNNSLVGDSTSCETNNSLVRDSTSCETNNSLVRDSTSCETNNSVVRDSISCETNNSLVGDSTSCKTNNSVVRDSTSCETNTVVKNLTSCEIMSDENGVTSCEKNMSIIKDLSSCETKTDAHLHNRTEAEKKIHCDTKSVIKARKLMTDKSPSNNTLIDSVRGVHTVDEPHGDKSTDSNHITNTNESDTLKLHVNDNITYNDDSLHNGMARKELKNTVSQHQKEQFLNEDKNVIVQIQENERDFQKSGSGFKFAGFQTAAGKTLNVSDMSLKNVKTLMENSDELSGNGEKSCPVTVDSQKSWMYNSPEKTDVSLKCAGFQSAAGKMLSMSDASLKKAKTLMEDCDALSDNEGKCCTVMGDSIKSQKMYKCGKKSGFQSAAGKTLILNETSVKEAKLLMDECRDSLRVEGESYTTSIDQAVNKCGDMTTVDNMYADSQTAVGPGFHTAGGPGFQTAGSSVFQIAGSSGFHIAGDSGVQTAGGSGFQTVGCPPFQPAVGSAKGYGFQTAVGPGFQTAEGSSFQTAGGPGFQSAGCSAFQPDGGTGFQTAGGSGFQIAGSSGFQTVGGSDFHIAGDSGCQTAEGSGFQTAGSPGFQTAGGSGFQTARGTSFHTAGGSGAGVGFQMVGGTGFQTAGGKALKLTDLSLKKAKLLLEESEDNLIQNESIMINDPNYLGKDNFTCDTDYKDNNVRTQSDRTNIQGSSQLVFNTNKGIVAQEKLSYRPSEYSREHGVQKQDILLKCKSIQKGNNSICDKRKKNIFADIFEEFGGCEPDSMNSRENGLKDVKSLGFQTAGGSSIGYHTTGRNDMEFRGSAMDFKRRGSSVSGLQNGGKRTMSVSVELKQGNTGEDKTSQDKINENIKNDLEDTEEKITQMFSCVKDKTASIKPGTSRSYVNTSSRVYNSDSCPMKSATLASKFPVGSKVPKGFRPFKPPKIVKKSETKAVSIEKDPKQCRQNVTCCNQALVSASISVKDKKDTHEKCTQNLNNISKVQPTECMNVKDEKDTHEKCTQNLNNISKVQPTESMNVKDEKCTQNLNTISKVQPTESMNVKDDLPEKEEDETPDLDKTLMNEIFQDEMEASQHFSPESGKPMKSSVGHISVKLEVDLNHESVSTCGSLDRTEENTISNADAPNKTSIYALEIGQKCSEQFRVLATNHVTAVKFCKSKENTADSEKSRNLSDSDTNEQLIALNELGIIDDCFENLVLDVKYTKFPHCAKEKEILHSVQKCNENENRNIDIVNEGNTIPQICQTVQNPEMVNTHNPKPLSDVFKTASGKAIDVSTMSVTEAKKLWDNSPDDEPKKSFVKQNTLSTIRTDLNEMESHFVLQEFLNDDGFQSQTLKSEKEHDKMIINTDRDSTSSLNETCVNSKQDCPETNDDQEKYTDTKVYLDHRNDDTVDLMQPFKSASGKKIGVSVSALEKARGLWNTARDDTSREVLNTGTTEDNVCKSLDSNLSNRQESHSADKAELPSQLSQYAGVFQTASGRDIGISETALKNARQTLMEDNFGDNEDESVLDVESVDVAKCSKLYASDRKVNKTLAQVVNAGFDVCDSRSEYLKNVDEIKVDNISARGSVFSPFQSASGKSISVTESALQIARESLHNEDRKTDPTHGYSASKRHLICSKSENTSPNRNILPGEKTNIKPLSGSGKSSLTSCREARISEKAMALPGEKLTKGNSTFQNVSHDKTFSGKSPFQTASGSDVTVSKTALQHILKEKTNDSNNVNKFMENKARGNVVPKESDVTVNLEDFLVPDDFFDDIEMTPDKKKVKQEPVTELKTETTKGFTTEPESVTQDRQVKNFHPKPVHCHNLHGKYQRQPLTSGPGIQSSTNSKQNKSSFSTPYKKCTTTQVTRSEKEQTVTCQSNTKKVLPVFVSKYQPSKSETVSINTVKQTSSSGGNSVAVEKSHQKYQRESTEIISKNTTQNTFRGNYVAAEKSISKYQSESTEIISKNTSTTQKPACLGGISVAAEERNNKYQSESREGGCPTRKQKGVNVSDNESVCRTVKTESRHWWMKQIIDARQKQEEIIQNNSRKKVRPVMGRLFTIKSTNHQNRIKIRDVIQLSHDSLRNNIKRQRVMNCVGKSVADVSASTSAQYTFDLRDHYGSDVTHVYTGDGAFLVPSDKGRAGKEEIYRAFLTLDGVDAKLVSESWFMNHYRWVVWKLAAYEITSPENFGGRALSPECLMLQMKYRYDREIDRCQRSALRKIMERDDSSCKRMILCVSNVFHKNSIPGNKKDPSTNEDTNTEVSLELTDGWYSIPAKLDQPLVDLVQKQKLVVGQKICVTGSEVVGAQDACSPLEAPASLMLKIYGNSTRPASWDSVLGFQRDPRPLCIPLSSVFDTGGLVGCLDVVVTRKYSIMYMEKSVDGCVFRTAEAEEKQRRQYEQHQQDKMEKLYRKMEEEFDQEDLDEKHVIKKTWKRKEIEHLQTGQELYEALRTSNQEDILQSYMDDNQMMMLMEYKRQVQDDKRQVLQNKFHQAWTDNQQDSAARNVIPLLKMRIVGCCKKDVDSRVSSVITIWKPGPEILELQEGSRYKIYGLTAALSRSKYTNYNIQLTASRQTKFRPVSVDENLLDMIYEPREVVTVSELKTRKCFLGEADFVGLLIQLSTGDEDNKKSCDTIYAMDVSGDLLGIRFWGGLKVYGHVDTLTEGKIFCVSNLMDKIPYRSSILPLLDASSEFSVFTQNAQNARQRKALNNLQSVIKNKGNKQCVQEAKIKLEELKERKRIGQLKYTPEKQHQRPQAHQTKSPTSLTSPCVSQREQTCNQSVYQSKMAKLLSYGSPSPLLPLSSPSNSSLGHHFKPPSSCKK